jgi:hypothetical protein
MMRVSLLRLCAWIELLPCWVLWCLAFVKPSRQAKAQKKAVRASSSRWSIGLVTLGFAMMWMWVRPFGFEKSMAELVVSMVLGPPSVALAWSAARELGKQWRYEAALGHCERMASWSMTGSPSHSASKTVAGSSGGCGGKPVSRNENSSCAN